MIEKKATSDTLQNFDNRKQGHLMIENKATSSSSGLWAVWAGTLFVAVHTVHSPAWAGYLRIGVRLNSKFGQSSSPFSRFWVNER